MNQQIKTSLGVIIILIVAATAGMFIWQIEKNQLEVVGNNNSVSAPIQKGCQNFPPPSFCPEGISDVAVTGTDSQGCSTYGCKSELNKNTDCAKEGESIGAVVPEVKLKQCCEGLTPIIPKNIVGTQGICTKTNDETANWQTYRNNKYRFEIAFPTACNIRESKSIWPYEAVIDVANCNAFDIQILGIDQKDLFKDSGPSGESKTYWEYGKDLKIGNYTWRKIVYKDEFNQEQLWYVIENEYGYVVSFGPGPIGGDIEQIANKQAPKLIQTLSTFKFTK